VCCNTTEQRYTTVQGTKTTRALTNSATRLYRWCSLLQVVFLPFVTFSAEFLRVPAVKRFSLSVDEKCMWWQGVMGLRWLTRNELSFLKIRRSSVSWFLRYRASFRFKYWSIDESQYLLKQKRTVEHTSSARHWKREDTWWQIECCAAGAKFGTSWNWKKNIGELSDEFCCSSSRLALHWGVSTYFTSLF